MGWESVENGSRERTWRICATWMRLARATGEMGASMMPHGSGLTMAGQMKKAKTRSTQMACTSRASIRIECVSNDLI